MRTLKQRKSETLRFVNKVRKALGLKPLRQLIKGIPKNCAECSLARSIGKNVEVSVDDGLEFIGNPVKAHIVAISTGMWNSDLESIGTVLDLDFPQIVKFLEDYDNLKYPELVAIEELLD
jgi:hypothetical protein